MIVLKYFVLIIVFVIILLIAYGILAIIPTNKKTKFYTAIIMLAINLVLSPIISRPINYWLDKKFEQYDSAQRDNYSNSTEVKPTAVPTPIETIVSKVTENDSNYLDNIKYANPSQLLAQSNNTLDVKITATAIFTVNDCLNKDQNKKSYNLTIEQPSMIWISFSHPNLTEDKEGWRILLRQDDKEIYSLLSKWNTPLSESTAVGLSAGNYTLTVEPSNLNDATYDLKVLAEKNITSENEINNSVSQAKVINILSGEVATMYGSLSRSDVDYYALDIPYDGVLAYNFKHTNQTDDRIGWNIRLLNYESEEIVKIDSNWQTTNSTSPNIGLSAGRYYLEVTPSNLNEAMYLLEVAYITNKNWEKEINDSISNVTEINTNNMYCGSLSSYNDVDYYSVNLPAGKYNFQFDHINIDDESNGWKIQVLDRNSQSILENDIYSKLNQTSKSCSFEIYKEDLYYIKISEASKFDNADYTFTIKKNN